MDSIVDQVPVAHSLLAGAASSIVSRLVTFPFDTVKARLQVQGSLDHAPQRYTSTANALHAILRHEGATALYRGFPAVAVLSIPATATYFFGYEVVGKRVLPPMPTPLVQDLATGLVAQLLAGLVFTGVDLVKERIQVAPMLAQPATAGSVLRGVLAQRGLTGLMTGYWMTNAVWVPWNMLYTATYEDLRRRSLSTPTASLSAAALATMATHPIDVVKTRVQVRGVTAGQVLRQLLAKEGPAALLHGLTARLLTIVPGTCVSWLVYEQAKAWLHDGGA